MKLFDEMYYLFGKYGLSLSDAGYFRLKKMGINENWKQAPDWFLQSLEIKINERELGISAQKGSAILEYNVGYCELDLEPYFLKKVSEGFVNKRRMEKIFLPQAAGEDQRKAVRETYRMIEQEIKESEGMKVFNSELNQLIQTYLKEKEQKK